MSGGRAFRSSLSRRGSLIRRLRRSCGILYALMDGPVQNSFGISLGVTLFQKSYRRHAPRNPGDEFPAIREGLLASRVAAWRKNVLVCTQVGVLFQPGKDQNVNSG